MNKNRQYEIFTQRLCSTLMKMYPNSKVLHDQVIDGHQIDVLMELATPFGTMLTIVECKNYNSSLEKNIARQLGFNMHELKAKGVLVTTCGFDPGILEIAEKNGDMMLLKVNFEETGEQILNVIVSVPQNHRFDYDRNTTTDRQREILDRLIHSGGAEELIIHTEDGAYIGRFREFKKQMSVDGEGRVYSTLSDRYIALPTNESVRLAAVEYDIVDLNPFANMEWMLPRRTIIIAHVENVLTGQKYSTEIDDIF